MEVHVPSLPLDVKLEAEETLTNARTLGITLEGVVSQRNVDSSTLDNQETPKVDLVDDYYIQGNLANFLLIHEHPDTEIFVCVQVEVFQNNFLKEGTNKMFYLSGRNGGKPKL